mmetsp:Transcript_30140/g.66285  ORF Transcript_30140/g.66285 Transcript_30140/m.66285 type:complete len:98 (+) Transcript_30140:315-608(+)
MRYQSHLSWSGVPDKSWRRFALSRTTAELQKMLSSSHKQGQCQNMTVRTSEGDGYWYIEEGGETKTWQHRIGYLGTYGSKPSSVARPFATRDLREGP